MRSASFVRRVLTVGMGSGLAQGITFLSMPIITRLYPPADYSGWAVLVSLSVLFTAVGTLRFDLAIVLPERDGDAKALMTLGLLASVGVAGLAACFLALFGREAVGESFYAALASWLWAIPLLVIMTALYQISCAWSVRTKEFFLYSLAQVLFPLCTVGLQIGLAMAGMGHAGGLIAGTVGGQALAALCLAFALVIKQRGRNQAMPGDGLLANLRAYRCYPFYMVPYTLVGTLRDRLTYLMLGNFGDQAQVGYYGLSSRATGMPNSLVSSAVRPVFFQWAARAGFASMERPIVLVLRGLVVAIIPAWTLFLIRADSVMALVFGPAWAAAGPYAAILSVAAIPLLLGNWLDRGFDVLGRQRLAMAMELFFSGMALLGLAAGIFVFHSVLLAIVFHVAALFVYYWVWLFALFRAAGFATAALWKLLGLAAMLTAVGSASAFVLTSALPFLLAAGIHLVLATTGAGLYLRSVLRDLRTKTQ